MKDKIIAISDTHFNCHQDNTNRKIIKFLEYILNDNYHDLWILGDMIEGHQLSSLDGVTSYWNEVFYLLKQFKKVRATTGNHDGNYISKLNFIEETNYIQDNNNVFLHGNCFDPLVSKNFIESVTKIYGKIERKIYNSARMNNNMLARAYNKYIIYRRAKEFVRNNVKINKLIMGHTHIAHTEKDEIINTGSWCDGNSDYLIYDRKENSFDLKKYACHTGE